MESEANLCTYGFADCSEAEDLPSLTQRQLSFLHCMAEAVVSAAQEMQLQYFIPPQMRLIQAGLFPPNLLIINNG